MTNLTIRVDFDSGESLGPGKVRLLEAVAETGSIRKAARLCGMSFRQAWLLLKAVEDMFGVSLTETLRGGVRGGGTRLTPAGTLIVKGYRRLERAAEQAAKIEMAALTANLRGAPIAGESSARKRRLVRKSLRK
jgi:molybdate transport system regulatory protein